MLASRRHLFSCCSSHCYLLSLCGCGSASNSPSALPDSVSLSLSPSFITLPADGTVSSIIATTARSTGQHQRHYALSAGGVPAGVTVTFTQPGTGTFGTIFLSSSSTVTPGANSITISATDGTATSSAVLSTTLNAVDGIALSTTSSALIARQDATPVSTNLTVSRTFGNTSSITVSASGLPTGLTASFTQPGTGTAGIGHLYDLHSAGPPPAFIPLSSPRPTAKQPPATATVSVTIGRGAHRFQRRGYQHRSQRRTSAAVHEYGLSAVITYNNSFFTSFPSTTDSALHW